MTRVTQSEKSHTEKQPAKISSLSAFAAIGGIAAMGVSILIGAKYLEQKDAATLYQQEVAELRMKNEAMRTLGNASVHFSDVVIMNDDVVVMIPSESGRCTDGVVGMNYSQIDTDGDGILESWELSLSQTDALGREYDRPTAQNDAAKVAALAADFCS